jgi:hypothetical protein
MSELSKLGFVVLPPGHGKSHHHGMLPGLIEADTVFNCKGTPALAALRKVAKETGNWETYDFLWANMIANRLTQHRWVIMVPSKSIGELLNGVYLGSGQLSDPQWEQNLRSRQKGLGAYEYCRLTDSDVEKFNSNDALSNWLLTVSMLWLEQSL